MCRLVSPTNVANRPVPQIPEHAHRDPADLRRIHADAAYAFATHRRPDSDDRKPGMGHRRKSAGPDRSANKLRRRTREHIPLALRSRILPRGQHQQLATEFGSLPPYSLEHARKPAIRKALLFVENEPYPDPVRFPRALRIVLVHECAVPLPPPQDSRVGKLLESPVNSHERDPHPLGQLFGAGQLVAGLEHSPLDRSADGLLDALVERHAFAGLNFQVTHKALPTRTLPPPPSPAPQPLPSPSRSPRWPRPQIAGPTELLYSLSRRPQAPRSRIHNSEPVAVKIVESRRGPSPRRAGAVPNATRTGSIRRAHS